MRADHTIASLPAGSGDKKQPVLRLSPTTTSASTCLLVNKQAEVEAEQQGETNNKAGELQPRASSGARPRPKWLWQVAGRVGWASARGCGSLVPERRRERDGRERAREASFEMRSSESTEKGAAYACSKKSE